MEEVTIQEAYDKANKLLGPILRDWLIKNDYLEKYLCIFTEETADWYFEDNAKEIVNDFRSAERYAPEGLMDLYYDQFIN